MVSDARCARRSASAPSSATRTNRHRTSTRLELFFDLCIVVASRPGGRGDCTTNCVEGHIADGVIGFAMGFFGVWWAWMNFTWFASAHDADDVPYRLLTLVQMAGALVYAAGVTDAVEDQVFTLAVIGYLIMRAGLDGPVAACRPQIPSMRRRALRYAGGVAVVQLLWLGILVAPPSWHRAAVPRARHRRARACPVWAERGVGHTARTYRLFHPEHIEERYGLFTIIVLGETILSATIGIREVAARRDLRRLIAVGVCGLLLAFGAWWLYFDHPGHLTPTPEVAIRWGYTHVVVFASLAALGAGVQVAAEAVDGEAIDRTGALAVAIPMAGYLVGLVLLMVAHPPRGHADDRSGSSSPAPTAILALGLLAPVTVAVGRRGRGRRRPGGTMVLVEPPVQPLERG